MRNDDAPDHDDKALLFRQLKKVSEKPGYENITLDSFIVSATPYDVLKKLRDGDWDRAKFEQYHIIFEDDLKEKMPLILYGENP